MNAVEAASSAIQLTRVNDDTCWLLTVDGTAILLDPWLGGPALVFHRRIHEAFLVGPVAPLEGLPTPELAIISHPFNDHCHPPSWPKVASSLPLYVPRVVAPFVRGRHFREVHVIPDRTRTGSSVRVGNVELSWCRAEKALDTTHNGLVIRGLRSGATVLYTPHALLLEGRTLDAVKEALGGRLDVFLCSFQRYDLPWYLGGVANLGAHHGLGLVELLAPRYVAPTHDAPKTESGFIATVGVFSPLDDLRGAIAARGLGAEVIDVGVGERWAASA